MTNASLSDQQLIDYSGEHLMHELSMFWELTEMLPTRKQGTSEYVALLESLATHLRNLIEFLCFESKAEYVRAQDFVDDPAAWPARAKLTPNLRSALTRANEEVSHLTTGRKSGSPPEKNWDTCALLKEIAAVAKEFAAQASDKKLHPRVREFLLLPPERMLVWIGDNVTHSNVASQTMSSPAALVALPYSSVSTQTQIISKSNLIKPT